VPLLWRLRVSVWLRMGREAGPGILLVADRPQR
jgi:hypothetical protein